MPLGNVSQSVSQLVSQYMQTHSFRLNERAFFLSLLTILIYFLSSLLPHKSAKHILVRCSSISSILGTASVFKAACVKGHLSREVSVFSQLIERIVVD